MAGLLGGLANAQPSAAAKAPSSIDWSEQTLRARGAGAPDFQAQNPAQARLGAERAALRDAFDNLLARVKGVAVDGTRTLGDLMAKDEVRVRVEGVLKGATIASKRYFSDQGVELELELPLALLADVVDPDAMPMAHVAIAGAPKGEPATGLIIDARGLAALPALLPRLLDEAGAPIYSLDWLSAASRKVSSAASYVQSLDEAKKSRKAGEKALVLKAAKTSGADLHLAAEDAKRVALLDESLLADGKVVIVVSPRSKKP